jgi:hypothetical protein
MSDQVKLARVCCINALKDRFRSAELGKREVYERRITSKKNVFNYMAICTGAECSVNTANIGWTLFQPLRGFSM